MNRTCFVLLAAMTATASAQWLETTIELQDSVRPFSLCYAAAGNRIYCAVWGAADSGTVAVIDGATDSLVAVVAVGRGPSDICYSPQGGKVYCANHWSDDVTVIDCATDEVVATVPVGSAPRLLCHDATHDRVYCANSLAHSVTIIDGVADTVVGTIDVGTYPYAMAWSPVQNRMYVANYTSSSISVIRDTTPAAVTETPSPRMPRAKGMPTVVRGVLTIPSSSVMRDGSCVLMDADGRKLMELRPGANDVSGLAPGVYFVRQAAGVTKVIVGRWASRTQAKGREESRPFVVE